MVNYGKKKYGKIMMVNYGPANAVIYYKNHITSS